MGKQNVDINALTILIRNSFNFEDLLQMCKALDIDEEHLGISPSQSQTLNALYLVNHMYHLGRIEQLLVVCDHMQGNISKQVPNEILTDWKSELKSLSNR